MLTVSDLKEACEAIEREYGSDGNVIIQIRDAKGSLINGTYAESMTRDSSGTLYLIGNDIIKPRIGFDRREECPRHDEVFGCADCTAEHCDYY